MAELLDFRKVDCKLWEGNVGIFFEIYKATNSNPCPGCAFERNCAGKKDLGRRDRLRSGISHKHTNGEIARKLNVSKRQVSKMKKKGTLPSEYR